MKRKNENRDILDNLSALRDQLHVARLNFNHATEPELVDACVFELNALQSRYNFFLRLAREKGLERSYSDAGVAVSN